MGRPPQCDHCCPTTTTTTTTTIEPPSTTPPPPTTPPPIPCSFYSVSYFWCRYRYDSDAGQFFFVEGSVPFNCNCFCPGTSRVYTDFVATNGEPPSDGACLTYVMPCCTPDNVDSFSCEPFGIIVEATCPDDPPPLPTTTTTTTTTEDPLLTTTTTAGPTTTPTPPIPYSVAWCTSSFCGNPCCENNTDKSYIYGPSDCQQFSNQEDALRFQEDLTDYISIEFQGTCSDIVTNFCFLCNNSCCPQTTTTTSEPTTTTTTTQDPSFGACILCNDGEIICTDEVTSSTCDFFADIINANWSQFYPNENCSDHPEVGGDCAGFTTTTTTEAPTTTTTTEDPLLTTTLEPTTTFPPIAYRCVECLDPSFCIDSAIRVEPCEGDFIYIGRGCTGPITYNPEQDCPNGAWKDNLCSTTFFAPCETCHCSDGGGGDGGGGDGGGGDDTTVNPFDPTS